MIQQVCDGSLNVSRVMAWNSCALIGVKNVYKNIL